MAFVWILLGFVFLVIGGEFLVRSSVALSLKLNIPKLIIGMTVVAFTASVPDILVSLRAVLDGSSDIALGNIIGSNIANVGLILGLTAFIFPMVIDKSFNGFIWSITMLFTVALYFLLKSGHVLDRREGVALVLSLIVFIVLAIHRSKNKVDAPIVQLDQSLQAVTGFKIAIWLIIGAVTLYFGSGWLVFGAQEIAVSLGFSERVIAVTVVAIGTSVPILATSLMAAFKKEHSLSVGNLIGANIFNVGAVLGITAMIHPIDVKNTQILNNDMLWMIGFAFVVLFLAFLPKKLVIGKFKAIFLLVLYFAFIVSVLYAP